MKFDNNGKKKVWNIDLDGTLTNGEMFWVKEPTPNKEMIDKVIEIYQSGNIVIIWTARQWKYAPETVGWLIKHGIPFHGIYMGKGGADYYVDDKSIAISDLIEKDVVVPSMRDSLVWYGGTTTGVSEEDGIIYNIPLLSCPNCGGNGEFVEDKYHDSNVAWSVTCERCNNVTGWYDTKKSAIEKWNQR